MATKNTDASKGTADKKAAENEKVVADESVVDAKVAKVDPDKVPAAPVSAIGQATAANNSDDPQFEDTGGLIFSHVAEEKAQEKADEDDDDA